MLVTAAVSLIPTFGAWHAARNVAEQEAALRFEVRATEIANSIRDRMLDYEQVLRGAAGLFAASQRVERAEWIAYVQSIKIERAYPGIQGLGFAPRVDAGGKVAVERAARADGLSAYAVFPAGAREAFVPTLYLQPLDERNRRALGYDMYSEPVRRRALDEARDSGEPAITGVVTLVQESDADVQPGFLLYMPVFRNGAPVTTAAERRRAIAGFVYSPFRARDLVTGIIGRNPGVEIRLSDATTAERPEEMFRDTARGAAQGRARPAWFSRTQSIAMRGRVWQLETATLPAFEAELGSNRPPQILAGGLAISALLLLIVWTLLTTRERARELARHMTVALRASEERLQLALASSHLALFDWDVAAGLVQLSPEWSVMLGGESAPTLVPVLKLQMLVHPEDAAAVQEKTRDLLEGQIASYRMEHRVRRLDGTWLWIESTARVNARDAEGHALRVTGANSDIRERKAIEEMKNEFIATVSHELRTPLTSMLASLGLVREGSAGELPADARKFVEIAYDNSERLAALVNDILDIERIEAGGLEIEIGTVECGEFLRRTVELNAAYGESRGVRFVLSGIEPGPKIRADADRLTQVLTNLLSNAAKHSPRGGEVGVAVADAGAMVRISVSDQGPGIATEFRPRLFGKFEQADGAQGGTGLGLAISKALVERMQGRIGCDSEPGQGSIFWVELPRD